MRSEIEQAVRLLQRDDDAGLEQALALLQNTVFSFSMRVCGQREDAEDTMQEVLLKSVPYQCGNVTNWCNDERDVEIDFLSDRRIEGFARGWEKFDCAKCKADGVKVITFTWIPK